MKHTNLKIVALLIIAGSLLSACGPRPEAVEVSGEGPAKVEHLKGPEPTRVTLTEDAAKRLDIQTAPVQGDAIPYAAVLYDTEGKTWVYTNPKPLVFVRSPITVDRIEGDKAFLSKGPTSGSAVVTIGAEELYGSETEFEEE
ncbi:MAG TPA: hypothetical protein VK249_13550 [Anaerolineales bacterium]|nr:hypothetical protein [Anaerolineales bacterium]